MPEDKSKTTGETETASTEPPEPAKSELEEVDLDKPLPGEVFVRACPTCGVLKQTADSTGKTECRKCQAKPKAEPEETKDSPTGEMTETRLGESFPIGEQDADVKHYTPAVPGIDKE